MFYVCKHHQVPNPSLSSVNPTQTSGLTTISIDIGDCHKFILLVFLQNTFSRTWKTLVGEKKTYDRFHCKVEEQITPSLIKKNFEDVETQYYDFEYIGDDVSAAAELAAFALVAETYQESHGLHEHLPAELPAADAAAATCAGARRCAG